jgi:hypothetical protein
VATEEGERRRPAARLALLDVLGLPDAVAT